MRRRKSTSSTWLNPPGASDEELELRTLTNLYNEMPAWLRGAHATIDRAVIDAYGWPSEIPDDQILERLLAENLRRASGPKPG